MEQLSKILDTAIKAPLWFLFALMLASGIPMFNIPNLVNIGIGADFKLFGVPLALIALLSTALFVASACARSIGALGNIAKSITQRFSFWWSLRNLDPESRAILYVIEEDGLNEVYYLPDNEHLSALRDHGFLLPSLVGQPRNWGVYRVASDYERSLRKYRGMARRQLRVEQELIRQVRERSSAATRAANQRI